MRQQHCSHDDSGRHTNTGLSIYTTSIPIYLSLDSISGPATNRTRPPSAILPRRDNADPKPKHLLHVPPNHQYHPHVPTTAHAAAQRTASQPVSECVASHRRPRRRAGCSEPRAIAADIVAKQYTSLVDELESYNIFAGASLARLHCYLANRRSFRGLPALLPALFGPCR